MNISKRLRLALFALTACVVSGATASAVQAAPTLEPTPESATLEASPVVKKDAPVFEAFSTWLTNYSKATPTVRTTLEGQGIALATERRKALQALMVFDPERALQLVLSPVQRAALPAGVVALLETPISARGEYLVMVRDFFGQQGGVKSRTQRTITANGKVFFVGVYGRRAGLTSKNLLAVSGFAIDKYLAVYPSPVRALQKDEIPPNDAPIGNPDMVCPISGKDASKGVIGDVGGVFFYFLGPKELNEFAARIERQEDIVDPKATGLDVAELDQ